MADQWGGQQQPEPPQQPQQQDAPGWPGGGTAPNWPPAGEQAQMPPYAAGAPSDAGYGPPPPYPPNYPSYPPSYPPTYAYAPVPPPQPQGTNGEAIAGFVLAFFLAPLGFIFSIIGLVKSNRLGGSGRGLAIAGIIISTLDAVVAIILILVLGVFSTAAVVASNAATNIGSGGNATQSSNGAGGVSDPGCTSAESSFQSMLGKIQADETKLSTDEASSDPTAMQTDLAAFTTDVQGIKTALDSALGQAQHQSVKDAIQTMDTDTNTVLTGLQAIEKGDTSQLSAFTDAAGRLGSDGDALDSLCSSL